MLEPQNALLHAEQLYIAGHESPEALAIWDYLTYGPWPNADAKKKYYALKLPAPTPYSALSAQSNRAGHVVKRAF